MWVAFAPCKIAMPTQLKRCSPSWLSVSFMVKRCSPDEEGRNCQGWIRFRLQLWAEMFQALGGFQGVQLRAGSSDSFLFCQNGENAPFPPLLLSSFLFLFSLYPVTAIFPLLLPASRSIQYLNPKSVCLWVYLPSLLPEMQQREAGLQSIRWESGSSVCKFLVLLLSRSVTLGKFFNFLVPLFPY